MNVDQALAFADGRREAEALTRAPLALESLAREVRFLMKLIETHRDYSAPMIKLCAAVRAGASDERLVSLARELAKNA